MPVLIIGIGFLVLFLIMGVMSLTAVASEHRFQREADDYKRITSVSTESTGESVRLKSAAVGR